MKKTILVLLLYFSSLSAYEIRPPEFKNQKVIDVAIAVYDIEISLLEKAAECPTQKLIRMYNERAQLNVSKKNYRAALADYQEALFYIESTNIDDPSNYLRGICECLFCYLCLDEEELAKKEFDKLIYQVALMGDKIDNIEWIVNTPLYPVYEQTFKSNKRKILLVNLPELAPEEFCELQCAGYAVAASAACLRVPNLAIAAVCGGCIWGLEQLCTRCCKGNGFWENCANPLRRLFHDPEHPNNPAPHPYE